MEDLRDFIRAVDQFGELRVIEGADWNLEIGAITELMAERRGPALLFDRISGYPPGYRVLTNPFSTVKRTVLVLNLPRDEGLTPLQLVDTWRRRYRDFKPIPPEEVKEAPLKENILTGEDIDVLKFPVCKWHEADGGRYIGTGCSVITRDPEEDWVNLGTYRVMVRGKDEVSIWSNFGQHGRVMMEKYHAKGLSAPVAVSLGDDPILWAGASHHLAWGVSEYEFAGWVKGKPIQVVRGEATDLPLPARAEIVLEGEVPPLDVDSYEQDGPFGEWVGYCTTRRRVFKMRVKAILHRNDPIMLGAPPLRPPTDYAWAIPALMSSGTIWEQLEKGGMTGVKGVWQHTGNHTPLLVVISVKQEYGGHAKHVGLAAFGTRTVTFGTKIVVVVDDDIDITDVHQVLWAITTRCDFDKDINIVGPLRGFGSDPMTIPQVLAGKRPVTARMIIDACKPIDWQFPPTNIFSADYRKKIADKWQL